MKSSKREVSLTNFIRFHGTSLEIEGPFVEAVFLTSKEVTRRDANFDIIPCLNARIKIPRDILHLAAATRNFRKEPVTSLCSLCSLMCG